ncbi:hypothetical protein SCHPADRAFT_866063 [Schizopora paradoxa]|uniref:Shr3 amino acid permease chaperone n=1 Tax=Schizopora paradoxa TaxID=27342 RepID=A0A0H2S4D5_9AGAM|nr:hypothetical protein SCHPADRAFT_866063 [Schizopora paradoxa]
MAIRVSVAICTTSFLLGILFTHWIADSLTLWKVPITTENIWTSASYYSLFARSPPELGYALAAIVTLGAATILWSLGDGAAGNLMFDGASIFLYGTAIAVYLYKVIPVFDDTFSSVVIPVPSSVPLPPSLRFEVLNLASAHLVCSVALTGVMALQAARWWSEHADDEDDTDLLSPSAEQHAQKRTGRKHSPSAQRRARRRKNSASKISASGTASRLSAATAAAASDLKGIKE